VFVGVIAECGLDSVVIEPGSLTTKNVSEIIAGDVTEVEEWQHLDEDKRSILLYICKLLSERAALMVAVPVATFLNRMERESSTVAVTGSLYQWHPTLAKSLERQIKRLSSYSFSLQLSEDGSGKGAGLIAAIADRLAKNKK
jgi:hexokinase